MACHDEEGGQPVEYISNARNLIKQFNKLADQGRQKKEWKSGHEVVGSPNEQQKSIRVQLREVLFNPRSSHDVNNNNNINNSKTDIETNPGPNQTDTDELYGSPDEEVDISENISTNTLAEEHIIIHTNKMTQVKKKDNDVAGCKPINKVGRNVNDSSSDSHKNEQHTSNDIARKARSREETNRAIGKTIKPGEEEPVSITVRPSSRFAMNTNTSTKSDENASVPTPTDRLATAANRAERRAKRAQRSALRTDFSIDSTKGVAPDASTVTVNISPESTNPPIVVKNGSPNETKTDEKSSLGKDVVTAKSPSKVEGKERKSSGSSVRDRISTWAREPSTTPKYGSAAGPSKFQFGTDYSKKTSTPAPTAAQRRTIGRIAPNKYTPTLNKPEQKSPTRRFSPTSKIGDGSSNTSRHQNDESTAPAITGSAADRMSQFRDAREKEKAEKSKEEEKKKQAEEKRKQIEETRKQEEKKRQDAELLRKEEERKVLEAKAEEEIKNAIPDSEKIKHIAPCQKKRERKVSRRTMSISNIVLDWVQEMTKDYPVDIRNFSASWNDGMAFCALIHHFNPDEFDFNELKPENKRYNFDLAFNTGAKVKKIPILLDTDDMVRMKKPEPRSVQTYIQWIWSVYGPTSGYGPTPQEIQNASMH